MNLLILAADEDDALEFTRRRPEVTAKNHLTLVWPANLDRARTGTFDQLVTTAAAQLHCRFDQVSAACLTRVKGHAVIR